MEAFIMIITFIIKALFYIMCGIILCLIPFFISALSFFIAYLISGKRLPKRQVPPIKIKSHNFLVRLFILFPRRWVLDQFNKDPDAFPYHGLHIFAGEQGSGKTLTMIHFANKLRHQFPMTNIRANFQVDFADSKIEDIDDIIFTNNGVYGEIQMIDEIQTWFNSLESKNFPLDMIQEICQQRKQRKIILGTSQVFTRVAKAIREQTAFLYEPLTILGCLTIVRVYKLKLNDDGCVDSKRRINLYFFVHDDYLRNCYDTYEKIKRLNKKGFKPKTEQISNIPQPIINVDSNAKHSIIPKIN